MICTGPGRSAARAWFRESQRATMKDKMEETAWFDDSKSLVGRRPAHRRPRAVNVRPQRSANRLMGRPGGTRVASFLWVGVVSSGGRARWGPAAAREQGGPGPQRRVLELEG